jgi:hypothetical protein
MRSTATGRVMLRRYRALIVKYLQHGWDCVVPEMIIDAVTAIVDAVTVRERGNNGLPSLSDVTAL